MPIKPKYNHGDAILFPHCWGETYSDKNYFKYGEVLCGFILQIEYVKAKDIFLYHVGYANAEYPYVPHYKTLGEHMIFNIDEYDQCYDKVLELTGEKDNEYPL